MFRSLCTFPLIGMFSSGSHSTCWCSVGQRAAMGLRLHAGSNVGTVAEPLANQSLRTHLFLQRGTYTSSQLVSGGKSRTSPCWLISKTSPPNQNCPQGAEQVETVELAGPTGKSSLPSHSLKSNKPRRENKLCGHEVCPRLK